MSSPTDADRGPQDEDPRFTLHGPSDLIRQAADAEFAALKRDDSEPTDATTPAAGERAEPARKLKKCEACWHISSTAEYIHVRTINGGLQLCRQCLDCINRKNPELHALRAALAAAEADAARLRARVAELEAGLRPFAEAGRVVKDGSPDGRIWIWFRRDQYRRAAALLTPEAQQ